MQRQMEVCNQLVSMEQGLLQNSRYRLHYATILFISMGFSLRASKRSTTSLSVVSVQATEIPPKETVTYSKQTQTANTGGVERDGGYSLNVMPIFFNVKSFYFDPKTFQSSQNRCLHFILNFFANFPF